MGGRPWPRSDGEAVNRRDLGGSRIRSSPMRGRFAIAALVALLIGVAPNAAQAETRYSVAGGCFTLASASSGTSATGVTQLRFQATDLGSYLLYTNSAQFLTAGGGGTVAPAAQPSPAADWVVEDAAGG